MSRIIGIDLGTTNTVAAAIEGGQPVIIPTRQGRNLLPSVVAFRDGERLIGDPARNQAITNPLNTIFSVKRFMGRRYHDYEVQEMIKHGLPYHVEFAANDDVRLLLGGRAYSPQEISAMILQEVRRNAERFLGEPVTEAVITVPANFDDAQRKATRDAGRIAGLAVRRIINEPTASAMAYGLSHHGDAKVAVYDLGGGTFDVTIMDVGDGVFEVRSTCGHPHHGGDDVDQMIVTWLIEAYAEQYNETLPVDGAALRRLRLEAEAAKIALSAGMSTTIRLPFIGPNRNLQATLTRPRLETLLHDFLDTTLDHCQAALNDAGLQRDAVDQVLLVGGMSHIPYLQQRVSVFFGQEPRRLPNPEEVVAVGAAMQAGIISGDLRDVLLLDVTPLTLGIAQEGDVFLPIIDRNTTIPTKKSQIVTTANDNQKDLHVQVYQGERPLITDNRLLDDFALGGIRPARRGEPRIQITFDIDASGLLLVSAIDKATGHEAQITVTPTGGLTETEIARMIREAEANAAEDIARLREVEAQVRAEQEAKRRYGTGRLGRDSVFLNYAHTDGSELAERLSMDLSAAGCTVVWDQGQYPKGEQEAMYKAIDEADVMVAILTPDTVNSSETDYVRRGWQYAILQRNKRVIPFLAPGYDRRNLPPVFNFPPINGTQDYAHALQHLLDLLRSARK